jgi:hypothetical protein
MADLSIVKALPHLCPLTTQTPLVKVSTVILGE